ncbi:MAG: hypothetical protein ACW99U_05090 [Candidatus Thorarchaeota archaeon]|jgi:hypothetical protein
MMATIMSIFPVIALIVAIVFAFLVFKQLLRRRRLYQFIWFISLIMFTVTIGFEVFSEFIGWNVAIYRVYLVLSASQVAIMGAGALYLILAKNVFSTKGLLAIDGILVGIAGFFSLMMTISTITDYSALVFGALDYPIAGIGTYAILIVLAFVLGRNMDENKRKMLHGHVFLVFSIILTLWMGAYAAVAEVFTENFVAGIAVAGHAMAQHVRNFSPILSVTGGFLLIGAAFFSFVKTRFTFNLWIALGGLAIALAGSIARSGAEFGNVLYLGEVVGVLLLTKGFYDSDRMIKEKHERTDSIEVGDVPGSGDLSE